MTRPPLSTVRIGGSRGPGTVPGDSPAPSRPSGLASGGASLPARSRPAAPHLFLTGPTYVRPEILAAMAQPMVGHRGPEFAGLYRRVADRLGRYAGTRALPILCTSSATALLETAVRSLVARRVLHTVCGSFGARWEEISRSNGKATAVLEAPPGKVVRAEPIRDALATGGFDAVCVTHSETSTGALHDLSSIAEAVREFPDVLLLIDAVSSFAAVPIDLDGLGVDFLVTGTQKALALPPGLSIGFASQRALERARAAREPGWYLSLARLAESAAQGGVPTSPCIPLFYALDRQLDDLLAETLPVRAERHARMARAAEAFCAEAELEVLPEPGFRCPALTVALTPGLDAERIRALARERSWVLGSGYGPLKGRCFRIGHMGDHDDEELAELLAALGEIVHELRG